MQQLFSLKLKVLLSSLWLFYKKNLSKAFCVVFYLFPALPTRKFQFSDSILSVSGRNSLSKKVVEVHRSRDREEHLSKHHE